MEFNIEETGVLSYCLKVEVSAQDLEPDINRAVRKHRAQLQMKGFRPGHVPAGMVRRLYGKELAQEAVRGLLEEMYQDLVLDSGRYDVWQDSEAYDYDYEYEKDLTARITFAEQPSIELQDVEGEEIEVPSDDVTEEHVEQALEDILWNYGDLQSLEEGAAIEEGDILTYDLQEIDPKLRAPIVGTARKGQELMLSKESSAVEKALREAALGAQVGSVVRFEVDLEDKGVVQDVVERRSYEASITDAKRWRAAEVTDELVRRVTGEEEQSADTFRDWVAAVTGIKLRRRNEEIRQATMIDRLLEMHEFEVPQLAIDRFLESALRRELARGTVDASAEGSIEALRARLEPVVERQARWIFLRDALLAEHGIDVSETDVRRDLVERAHGDVVDGLYMNQEPVDFLEHGRTDPASVAYRVRNKKLFEKLAESFQVQSDETANEEEAEPELLEE